MAIAIIEDNDEVRETIKAILSEFDVYDFSCPQEFLMSGIICDLVVSDWDFGHVTLEFFKGSFDPKKLIVLTGSGMPVAIDCIGVYSKMVDGRNLAKIIGSILAR